MYGWMDDVEDESLHWEWGCCGGMDAKLLTLRVVDERCGWICWVLACELCENVGWDGI